MVLNVIMQHHHYKMIVSYDHVLHVVAKDRIILKQFQISHLFNGPLYAGRQKKRRRRKKKAGSLAGGGGGGGLVCFASTKWSECMQPHYVLMDDPS